MSKTYRREPTRKKNREAKLEREFMKQRRVRLGDEREEVILSVGEEAKVEQVKAEAEAIMNARLAQERAARQSFSVQSPASDEPVESGSGFLWWSGGTLDTYIPLSEYGSPQRLSDIRAFALVAPFILNAEAILAKKAQSLQWTLEGGRNLVLKWQRILNNFENGDGWDTFVARWIRAYCESDQPAYSELIRAAPTWAVDEQGQLTPRGEAAMAEGKDRVWPIVDARVMDPLCCFPTASEEFPLIYRNPHTGTRYRLRPYQFMSLVDQPGVDDTRPRSAVCAVSRAVHAAQEDRMLTRFSMEKISENPGAGFVVVNTSANALKTAIASAEASREAKGVVYYKGIVFVPTLSPEGTASLQFLNFSELPEGFDQAENYQRIKEIVATSFGLDVLEFGSIQGRMGTATQAKVAAQKGRTKTMGSIMQGIERAFRYKLLPESIKFEIKKYDEEEERLRAERDEVYFNNAIRLAQFAPPEIAIQYLADKGAIPNEAPYIFQDLNLLESISDTASSEETNHPGARRPDRELGPEGTEDDVPKKSMDIIKMDRDGRIGVRMPPRSAPYPFVQNRAPMLYP